MRSFSLSGVILTVLVSTPAKLGTKICLQNGAYLMRIKGGAGISEESQRSNTMLCYAMRCIPRLVATEGLSAKPSSVLRAKYETVERDNI